MLKIGLTGGIGSGKSTAARAFEVLGVPVYYADDAAKRLMNDDVNLKQKVKAAFGEDIYSDGFLNKKKLADIVFSDPEKLAHLNSFVHPATIKDAANWMSQQTASYCIKEAALIFESGANQQLDYVIGVSTPFPQRIQRTMQRDGASREDVMSRMEKQLDENIKMKLCDFVLTNADREMLLPQILELHEKLLTLSKKTGDGKS